MVAALRCVRPQFQWYQLAYATEIKSIQLHDSIVRLSQKIVSFTLHYITLHLAGAAGDLFRDGRHGSGMATIIPHWLITTGLLQRWSFLNRLDHYRRTAMQCHWTVTVPGLLSRCTSNRQPAWTRDPLLCWWWIDLRFRQGRSSRWDGQ